jgi:hypothetical protein
MARRILGNSGDGVYFSPAQFSALVPPVTYAVLVKRRTDGTTDYLTRTIKGDFLQGFEIYVDDVNKMGLRMYRAAGEVGQFTSRDYMTVAKDWCILGFNKSTVASSSCRFFCIPLSTGVAAFENGTASVSWDSGAIDTVGIAFGDWDVACWAIWNRVLSDAEIDTLDSSFYAWTQLPGALSMWRFNQETVSNIPDYIGQAPQITLFGTTSVIADPTNFALNFDYAVRSMAVV